MLEETCAATFIAGVEEFELAGSDDASFGEVVALPF